MKKIVFLATVGIALMVIGLIGTTSAENVQSVLPVVDGVVRDGLYSPKDSIADVIMANVVVQVLDVERDSLPFEDRGILEFDVSTLSGPITSATLDLSVFSSNGPYPFKVDVFTYTGDGILSLNDFNVGTLFHTFGYSGDKTVQLDVTPFIKTIVSSGDQYAGFNLQFAEPSTIPMNSPFVAFNSLEYPPAATLTIRTYTQIISCDNDGKEKNEFEPGESVYVKGIRLEADTTYRIWIQYDPVSEGDLLTVTEDPSGVQEEITTNANGDFGPEPIWSIPSYASPTHDKFDIVVDKLDDGGNTGYYNAASDGLDSVTVVGFVAPADTEPPTIESVTLDTYTTIPDARIHVTVEATDNVGVTSVTADGVALVETGSMSKGDMAALSSRPKKQKKIIIEQEAGSIWEGDITAPSAPGGYTLTIRAEDAAGNFAEATVDYSVVTPQGGFGVAVLPLFSNVIAGDTVDLTVKIISTENFDDHLHVYLSTEGLDNPVDLGWFNWTEKNVMIPTRGEITIPLKAEVPTGVAGIKMFRVKVESTIWMTEGFGTGMFGIT